MSNFKVGDIVYFLHTAFGRRWGNGDTIIRPRDVQILSGKIVRINKEDDYVHLYIKDDPTILTMGYAFLDTHVFKTYLDALDAMIKRLDAMRHNYKEKNANLSHFAIVESSEPE